MTKLTNQTILEFKLTEDERLKILLYNMADAYLLEMSESELREFLTIEIGFTESEYDSYIKKY